jgi:hypothetical protein
MSIITCVSRRGVVCVAGVLALAPSATSSAAASIPSPMFSNSVQFASDLQPIVDAMLRTSPTFRSMYSRVVSSPLLVVDVRADPTLVSRTFMARSTIRRYESGLIVVTVVVGPGHGQAGWIAHEFGHIVEQLDGLDLRALADHRAKGVWYSGDKMIETSRAIRAGRAVVDEMSGRTRRSDNLVE